MESQRLQIAASCSFDEVGRHQQARYQVHFDIGRPDGKTEVLVEQEDGAGLWSGVFDDSFVEKINARFGSAYTQHSLFSKMARALKSGSPAVVFDWLTAEAVSSMAGRSATPEGGRILVMVESSSGKQTSIPLPLSAADCALAAVVQRLKRDKASPSAGLFLTGAGVVGNDAEKDEMSKEIKTLKAALEKAKEAGTREANSAKGGAAVEQELRALRAKTAELQIELSALPVLKAQLQDKARELEVMHMYAREVEICAKIRAPIPNVNAYRQSLLGPDTPDAFGTSNKKPAVSSNTRGRHAGPPNTNGRGLPGTAPVRKSTERKQFVPSRELAGVYQTQLSTGNSRKTSTSKASSPGRSQSKGHSKKKDTIPQIAKAGSHNKFTGYNVDYKLKPKTSGYGASGGGGYGGYGGGRSRPANKYVSRLY